MFSRFTNYIRETRHELHKVNWPTRRQTVQYTGVVIAISLAVSFFLGAFDFIYQTLLREFIGF